MPKRQQRSADVAACSARKATVMTCWAMLVPALWEEAHDQQEPSVLMECQHSVNHSQVFQCPAALIVQLED
eukprot:1361786-Amphidinium_carterae.3